MQLFEDLIFSAPGYGVGALVFGLMLLASEAGFRLGARGRVRHADDVKAETSEDYVMASIMGLLALLIAFSFSAALGRYESRRGYVLAEANGLSTAALRIELLESPHDARLGAQLRAYVAARNRLVAQPITAFGTRGVHDEIVAKLSESVRLQREIWASIKELVRAESDSPLIVRAVIDSLNESFDMADARAAEFFARVPPAVVVAMLLYALLTAFVRGRRLGIGGNRNLVSNAFQLLLLSLAISLVMDLDRPNSGLIRVPQQPMLDLEVNLNAAGS